jgi:HSP20 family protein
MDVHYKKDTNDVVASFELPGLQKEDVSIDVHNNVLTVSGQSNTSSEHNEDGYVVRERRHGKFTRALSLPQGLKVSFSDRSYSCQLLTTIRMRILKHPW